MINEHNYTKQKRNVNNTVKKLIAANQERNVINVKNYLMQVMKLTT